MPPPLGFLFLVRAPVDHVPRRNNPESPFMKAFLLAAGHGTRLRPLTDKIPKCLVPIRGVPLLKIWFDLCSNSGIDELLVNIHAHAGTVADFAQQHSNGIRVTIVEEETLMGSAGTLAVNRDWVKNEESFWILYSDVLTRADLNAMLRFHREHKLMATLGVYHVPDPRRCGIVTLTSDGTVIDFEEKPMRPKTDLAFAGLMIAKPAVLDVIPSELPKDIGFDLLPRLTGYMRAYNISEYLLDIGTLENYETAQKTWPGF
jgi:mannose-1-phosphate guanylyltransferase